MTRRSHLPLSVCLILWLSSFLLTEGFLERGWIGATRPWRAHRSFLLTEGFLERGWIGATRPWRAHYHWLRVAIDGPNGDIPQRRTRQVRRKPRNRHPRGYWQDIENVETELRQFWTNLGVTLSPQEPPIIPNETLLHHFERNDLRYAIVSYRGRKSLSARLRGARIMHGRWAVAVQQSPELQQLVRNATHGLSPSLPPLTPQQKKQHQVNSTITSAANTTLRNQTRWNHSPGRKPKGYWTMELVIRELYQYLDDYQQHMNRPSVWMPRLAELKREGRDDLRQAIVRFGGSARICRLARLITYREWHYLEGQYELLVDLRDYLDKFHHGDRTTFPCATDMEHNGYHQLYSLTQFYGGSKFLANRLSMSFYIHANTARHYADLNWGPFSIDTAIELLRFIRADQMRKKGPLKRPVLAIPSQKKLLASGEEKLHGQIMELGGYENVARRLGLAYFD